jgi:hypothetical protein
VNGVDPDGYDTLRSEGRVWLIRPGLKAALAASPAAALLEGDPPPPGLPGTGRGGAMPLVLAGRACYAKRGVHGGLARHLLGGLFWRDRRARLAVEAAGRLRTAGVSTPDVLAAGCRPVFGPLAAYVLVTEAIPGGVSLQAFLGGQPLPRRRRLLAREAGRCVRALHDAGFVHADLNLANLVAAHGGEGGGSRGERGGPGGSAVHVIDLEGGRFRARVGFGARRANLRRLLRSYEKWIAPVSPLDRRDALAFLRAYCRDDEAWLRRCLGDLAGPAARFRWRRLAWRHAQRVPPVS